MLLNKNTKRRSTMRRIFGFFIGVMAGGLIGGLVALLLAPASGEELRGHVHGRATGFADEIRGAAAERRAVLEQRLAELRAPRRRKAEESEE
jgi:gas vesicle protein